MSKINNISKSLFTFNKIIVFITLASLIYLIISVSKNSSKQISLDMSDSQIVIDDHVMGDRNSKVVVVEYLDLQCPNCAAWDPLVKEMFDRHKKDIALVHRHFPLSMHLNAMLAAKAAEAASIQGKFYEMKELLFAKQDQWSNSLRGKEFMINYAESLGLNLSQFEYDLESESVENRILRDQKSAQRSGVQATPTFFINGKHIDNSLILNQEGWDSEIAKALAQAK